MRNKNIVLGLGDIQKYIIAFMILIPASSFILFRSFLLLTFSLTMFLYFFKRKTVNKKILFMIGIISFITIEFFYSLLINTNFTDSNIASFVRYLTFFIFLFLLILSYEHKILTTKKVLKGVFLGLFTFNFIKVTLILLVPFGFLTARELVEFVTSFNIIVTAGYWTEDAAFSRLSFGNDILNPFLLLFFVVINNKYKIYSKKVESFFIFISFLAALFSFTRSIWIYEILVIFYKYIIIDKNYKLILFGIIILVSLITYVAIEYTFILETFYIRLFDSPSLDMKALQANALIDQFSNLFFFGSGIGAYLPDFIRSSSLNFIYEVQIYALLMQLGIVGFSILIIFFVWIIVPNRKFFINSFPLYLFYMLWLLSGFTNPYLFILTSIFIYFVFYILLREKYNSFYASKGNI